ncbi:hypothetical protein ABE530_08430 [Brucella sp. TWI559]
MADTVLPFSVSGSVDPSKIRVVLFANNRFVHIALADLVKPLTDEIASLKTRIETLEG